MKRIITVVALLSLLSSAYAGEGLEKKSTRADLAKQELKYTDWRSGQWNRNVPEHLLSINIGGMSVITAGYKNVTPFALGLTAGYQYKMRHWEINPSFTASWGGYTGVYYYRGAAVKHTAEGARHDIITDRYKSHTYVPLMLSINLHYDFKHTSIYLGADAGANLMIGEKDLEKDGAIYLQKNTDELRITRFVPSARVKLGFMQELNPLIKLRFQAGVQYELGYKDDYNGMYYNGGFIPEDSKTDFKNDASIDPFAEIGIVFSL